jgi:hypothetical protein
LKVSVHLSLTRLIHSGQWDFSILGTRGKNLVRNGPYDNLQRIQFHGQVCSTVRQYRMPCELRNYLVPLNLTSADSIKIIRCHPQEVQVITKYLRIGGRKTRLLHQQSTIFSAEIDNQ